MGLDMYLTKRIYVGGNYDWNEVQGIVDITTKGKQIPVNLKKVTYIEEEIAYWRKANAIHKWFVDNVQDGNDDCKDYYVRIGQLKELLELCEKVKKVAKTKKGKIETGITYKGNGEVIHNYTEGKVIENVDEVAKLLPTQEGFFFGGTGYNEFYLEDIDYTIKALKELMKEVTEYNKQGLYFDCYYHSSW